MVDKNPVLDQDRAEDLIDNWRKYHYTMFPQQRAIYKQLGEILRYTDVLEAGCGNGTGGGIIYAERMDSIYVGTDVSQSNVDFCRCLYPWMEFEVWDINQPWHGKVSSANFTMSKDKFDAVVCIECLEHVADPLFALKHLLGAAKKYLWISTPNGEGKPRPPANPHHVREYTVEEMTEMLFDVGARRINVLDWETFQPSVTADPLVYKVTL